MGENELFFFLTRPSVKKRRDKRLARRAGYHGICIHIESLERIAEDQSTNAFGSMDSIIFRFKIFLYRGTTR